MGSSGPWQVERAGLRTSFTKTANVLKAELVNVDFSVDLVHNKFTKLQSVYLDIKILDEKILGLLAEDVKSLESDITNEIEDCKVYSDDFITLSWQVGQVRQLKGGLTTVYTKLGWVICGASDEIIRDKDRTAPTLCASLAVHDFNISDLWSLEAIRILDANQNLSNAVEEEIAHDQFLSSLTRKENGRYCMGLPWLVELPSNFQVAEKRLFGITRRLRSLHKYEEYDGVFRECLDEGVIEMVPDRELNSKGHYLPHHPVFKPDSVTTKIRSIFDTSCKVGRSPSLNDCLVK
ncbi:integrase catalytic domain-containing protein [Trichonephila clavipes]|nr:integrase catalytic domain-containing protein [Trichonephila clavipes]